MHRATSDALERRPSAGISAPDFFRALANETRLRSLVLLSHQDELCVCELTFTLGLSQPHISRHLGQLRETGLASDRRDGVWVYYRINQALPTWALEVLQQTAKGVAFIAPFQGDVVALAEMPNRPGAVLCA